MRPVRLRRLATAGLLCGIEVGLVTCSSDVPGRVGDLSIRDSLGVHIVEIPADLVGSLPTWRLDTLPRLTIGEVDGDAAYLFGRVEDAARFSNGEILVLDGQSRVLRVFGVDGVFQRQFGGRGEGPAEFLSPSFLRTTSTGFAVYDRRLSKLAMFDAEEGLVDTRTVTLEGCEPHDPRYRFPSCYVSGLLSDLTLVTTGFDPPPESTPTRPGEIKTTDRRTFSVGIGDGRDVTTLEAYPSETTTYIHDEGGEWVWFIPTAFDWGGSFAAGRTRIAVARSDVFEFRVWEESGDHALTIRVLQDPTILDDEWLAPLRDWVATGLSEHPVDEYLARVPFPETVPYFGEFFLDEVDRLWVAEYAPSVELLPRDTWEWTVFSADGLPLAQVTTGPPETLLEVGEDYALIRHEDDLGVHSVQLVSLLGR